MPCLEPYNEWVFYNFFKFFSCELFLNHSINASMSENPEIVSFGMYLGESFYSEALFTVLR